ncbi:hypothetical protein FCL53_10610 [Elizabethkingia meningoseptica]|uniref:hypothetical protein n=1 Tax=Elizabethkingia meningoseptica TaxID=238 RepID=UPI001365DD4F|nr:hypothetical protein [Elizabethkingia meningoseptica]MVW92416.1 hypothetical protein [Elizabethkingia meningoseptica]
MEFKGTKGKWILDGVDGELFMISSDINDKGNVICQMPDKIVCEESQIYWNANAKLISKAPEMLRAMQKFCDRVENGEVKSVKTYNEFKQLIKEAIE